MWRKNDWIWITSVLGFVIIVLSVLLLRDVKISFEIVSFTSTILSMVLAVIAIFVTLVYSKDSKDISKDTGELLNRMDEKLNVVRENIIRIDKNNVYTLKSQDSTQSKKENRKMSRIHGILSTVDKLDWKKFVTIHS